MVADAGGFADDDTGAVVDEEMRADLRAGMDVGARALMRVLGHHARQQRNFAAIERVGDPLQGDDEHAGVGEDDFLDAAGGRITLVGGDDVGVDGAADVGEFTEQFHRQRPGGAGGIGVAGKPQALLEFGDETPVDLADAFGGGGRDGILAERILVEEAREQQAHAVGTQPVDRLLGRQVGAVEVIDAAVPLVGTEQRVGDVLERLGHGQR